MNFKDLQFSLGKLTTDVKSQLAQHNPLTKPETKTLSTWITKERDDLSAMRLQTYQRRQTATAFKQWSEEQKREEKMAGGNDIEDIADKLDRLLRKQFEIEDAYSQKFQKYRHAIKIIRDREEKLSPSREKKATLRARINNLSKSSPKSPLISKMKKELESLEDATHGKELEMGDFKRFALKEAFYLRFNAMHEYAAKSAIIAGFGKYIVDLLDIEPTPPEEPSRRPYEKGQDAAMILADAILAVDDWKPAGSDERPTLATQAVADNAADVPSDFSVSPTTSEISQAVSPKVPELPPRNPSLLTAKEPEETSAVQSTDATETVKENEATEEVEHAEETQPVVAPELTENAELKEDKLLNEEIESNQVETQSAPPAYSVESESLVQIPGAPHPSHRQLPRPDTTCASGVFSSPMQSFSSADPTIYQSPQPMSSYLPNLPGRAPEPSQSTGSYTSTPGGGYLYGYSNYTNLYRQISQRQQHAPSRRPYWEFQQQFRVGAGGFRVPEPYAFSANGEKERMAPQQYSNEGTSIKYADEEEAPVKREQDVQTERTEPPHSRTTDTATPKFQSPNAYPEKHEASSSSE